MMDPEKIQVAKRLFMEAAELPAHRRTDFVEEHCGDDQELRDHVEQMLQAVAHRAEAADTVQDTAPGPEAETIQTTAGRPSTEDRIGPYRIVDVLGEGGMGTVYLAEQEEPLQRTVALKVIKLGLDSQQVLARFELERQSLARMSHPAIAKVFDAGITELGQPFFVMEHVEGVPFDTYCDQNQLDLHTRIEIFRSVCQGVQHAHQKGVLHRDLKPANVLVAPKNELHTVKIIDFGLARATDRQLDESILTEQGLILGTPEFMSPEQARGAIDEIDTRTDVYSLGVMLYQILVGELPFSSAELRSAGLLEIQRVIQEVEPSKPSTRVSTLGDGASEWAQNRRLTTVALRKRLRGDLDWIVMKAMAKEPERRYESATSLAQDLARYLSDEPVSAGPPSASYRIGKFARKYHIQVSAAVLAFLVATIGSVVAWGFAVEAAANEKRALGEEQVATKQAAEAERERAKAKSVNTRFNRLSLVVKLEEVAEAMTDLQPPWPDKIEALQTWIREVGEPLAHQRSLVQQTLKELEEQARVVDAEGDEQTLEFDNPTYSFLHGTLKQVEQDLVKFAGENGELMRMRWRLQWAKRIEELTDRHPKARVSWADAAAAIAKADGVSASELYAAEHHDANGQPLRPQTGLVPIGMNPDTKLWEFYHLRSAYDPRSETDPASIEIPTHGEDGSILVEEQTGIVFVLVPGATFTMGCQKGDPKGANFDPMASGAEPVRKVTLPPFFIARHEITQAQWIRLSLSPNPSNYAGDGKQKNYVGGMVTKAHPVESVSWYRSSDLGRRHGLALPSEEEWEYACRAGTGTPWFAGKSVAHLGHHANVLDAGCKGKMPWSGRHASFDDGHLIHAPVGTYRPNRFGLHDMAGNVIEWTGTRFVNNAGSRLTYVARGGSYANEPLWARSADRADFTPKGGMSALGMRAARPVH